MRSGICLLQIWDPFKAHDSELRGQEEAGRTQQMIMSELFTCSTTVKLANALNKPKLKLLLSYQGLSARSNYTESVVQQ